MARRDEPRLDQPKSPRSLVLRPHYDPDAFGRFSETIARFIGTARFLVLMTVFVVVWVTFNVVLDVAYSRDPDYRACAAQRSAQIAAGEVARECERREPFDPYPFILLTLALSLQASYAAPLILLAQNRQADRDRVSLEEDRAQYARALAEAEFLAREIASIRIALGEVATRDFLRSELRDLADEVGEARRADARADEPA
ncbi:MAG TPA: DUF1003 domain-containing protein [Mycobacteriales bacterium]|jgi:uncharacterized membrane protein|nr:DUF1003 domain-containing protein [Mycobacteriales bacterium]